MAVHDAISLIILFGSFLLALLTYIDNHHKQ
ncbi:putative holin-like toxin [Weissella paramesenteroides]|nr:putative holin-like toxin [Weissella paramesenteroides]WEA53919.1 putative holin-like toxin [Weissella paramesenteroides]